MDADGSLVAGMMRPAESKIMAFENLALIDVGEPGWDKVSRPTHLPTYPRTYLPTYLPT